MADIILSGTFVFNNAGEVLFLYRADHHHYEKPGGKLEKNEVEDWEHPTIEELLARAKKEIEEEVGGIAVDEFDYLGFVDTAIPGDRTARAHAFTARFMGGDIVPTEDKFEHARFISLDETDRFTMSPDFKLFREKLIEYRKKNF